MSMISIGLLQALTRSTALALILFSVASFGCAAQARERHGDVTLVNPDESNSEALPPKSGGLTPEQSKLVLSLLDNDCADKWCETGDYDWHHKKIICSTESASCTLTVMLTKGDLPPVWRACKLGGYAGFPSIVEGGEGKEDLTVSFLDRMQDCADRIQSTV
jgi:hypothetical protein